MIDLGSNVMALLRYMATLEVEPFAALPFVIGVSATLAARKFDGTFVVIRFIIFYSFFIFLGILFSKMLRQLDGVCDIIDN